MEQHQAQGARGVQLRGEEARHRLAEHAAAPLRAVWQRRTASTLACFHLELHHSCAVKWDCPSTTIQMFRWEAYFLIGRFRYIACVKCPYRVAGKASALSAGSDPLWKSAHCGRPCRRRGPGGTPDRAPPHQTPPRRHRGDGSSSCAADILPSTRSTRVRRACAPPGAPGGPRSRGGRRCRCSSRHRPAARPSLGLRPGAYTRHFISST